MRTRKNTPPLFSLSDNFLRCTESTAPTHTHAHKTRSCAIACPVCAYSFVHRADVKISSDVLLRYNLYVTHFLGMLTLTQDQLRERHFQRNNPISIHVHGVRDFQTALSFPIWRQRTLSRKDRPASDQKSRQPQFFCCAWNWATKKARSKRSFSNVHWFSSRLRLAAVHRARERCSTRDEQRPRDSDSPVDRLSVWLSARQSLAEVSWRHSAHLANNEWRKNFLALKIKDSFSNASPLPQNAQI